MFRKATERQLGDRRWAPQDPSDLPSRIARVDLASTELHLQFGRPPSVSEIAARLQLTDTEVLEVFEANRHSSEDRTAAAAEAGTLEKHGRIVLDLRFSEEMTQFQIAERIGLSQMQVSRVLARGLAELRRLPRGDSSNR